MLAGTWTTLASQYKPPSVTTATGLEAFKGFLCVPRLSPQEVKKPKMFLPYWAAWLLGPLSGTIGRDAVK